MKHADKQPQRPSKAGLSPDKLHPPTDVDTQGATGGDRESRQPLHRPLKGAEQPQTPPGTGKKTGG